MPRPKPQKNPSLMSLMVTSAVALALFAGVVVIAKRLPIDGSDETTGSAPARDLPAPKASERALPARPDAPR